MMRINRRRTVIQLETLEGKAVPSTVLPVLTHHTLHQVMHQIDDAAGSAVKSHNSNAFDASLSRISYRIPFGHEQLLPTWRDDEGIFDAATKGSGLTMVKQIKVDLMQYIKDGVRNGDFRYR